MGMMMRDGHTFFFSFVLPAINSFNYGDKLNWNFKAIDAYLGILALFCAFNLILTLSLLNKEK